MNQNFGIKATSNAIMAAVSESSEATTTFTAAIPMTEQSEGGSSKQLRLYDMFEDESSHDSNLATSVSQYFSVCEHPNTEQRDNPHLYWKEYKNSTMVKLAKYYLSACPASVADESMFSTAGLLLNDK